MSIKLMSLVWPLQRFQPSTKIVLLSLCDYANDEGSSCFPSVDKIAEKACLSRRQAQRILHDLIEQEIISVIKNEHGGCPGSTRNYLIHPENLTDTKMSPLSEGRGDICDMRGVTPMTQTGDTHVTQTTNNHQEEPPLIIIPEIPENLFPDPPPPKDDQNVKSARRRKQTTFITEEFRPNIRELALATDLGVNTILECPKFIDHFLAKGESRADWDASFRTWIRNAARYSAERAERITNGRQNVRDVSGAVARVIALRHQA